MVGDRFTNTGILTLLLVFGLGGCVKVWPDVYTHGAFVGTYVGYVELGDGTPIGLRVVTHVVEKSGSGYTLEGNASLGGEFYRLEGEERSDDDRVHYLATPPPHTFITVALLDEGGEARYRLEFYVTLVDSWPSDYREGSFSDSVGVIGTVRLRQVLE